MNTQQDLVVVEDTQDFSVLRDLSNLEIALIGGGDIAGNLY